MARSVILFRKRIAPTMNDLNVVNNESAMPNFEKTMQFLEEHIPEQAL